ncbi:MAG: hypothetical protein Q9M23_02470 [Mariprofundaceae bacterium]|nr:hypothetical protein [Mariprofundaceae bacterium]
MRRWIAGALLLGLVAFLAAFIQLDEKALHTQLITLLEQATGRTVHSGKVRLSLQHGLSLKIAQLRLDGPGADWELHTDVVRFDIALVSLLFGDLRVSGIDMVHPVLRLSRPIAPGDVFSGPVSGKLMLQTPELSFRQGRIVLREEVLLDQMAVTLRRIDREQQTTWEVQSRYAGGDFSSQGYIRSGQHSGSNGGDKVFGRISATQLQLAQMPALPLPSLHYDMLDASLTFSLDAAGQWQWFGNMLSREEHAELPKLSWRGKVNGSSPSDFRLHDAFVQFGEKTRLVLLGGCEPGLPCELEINTRGANPGLILKAADIDIPLTGELDGNVELREQGKGWNLNGKLGLRGIRWDQSALPDTQIELSDLYMQSLYRYTLRHARIQPKSEEDGGQDGSIEIKQLSHHNDSMRVSAELKSLKDVWVPLGDLLMRHAGFEVGSDDTSGLSGSGENNASFDWVEEDGNKRLGFSINADSAAVLVAQYFAKPAGLTATVDGTYDSKAGTSRLHIGKLQLADSRFNKLDLVLSTEHPLLSVGSMQLDIDKLIVQGVMLPVVFADWQGEIRGAVHDLRIDTQRPVYQWLTAADADLQLNRFAADAQVWNGKLKLRHGRLITKGLSWHSGPDFVDFSADLDVGHLRGSVNIDRAGFSWSPENSLPDWLNRADFRGRFSASDMLWNGNIWKGMKGEFSAQKGIVKLNHVQAILGEGQVQSRAVELKAVAGGVRFTGQLGMSAVRLDDLAGLSDAVGAKMNGYAFANAHLDGTLPVGGGPWSGNGDIEIHRGLWHEAKPAHRIQWLNDAAEKLGEGERFDRLNVRFRLDDESLQLRRLKFTRDQLTASGKANLNAAGEVKGRLSVEKQGVVLDTGLAGRWPSINGFIQESATP